MGFFTRTAMDMLMKTTHPEINRRQCWNLHPHRKPCTECKDICPYGEQIFTRPNLVKDWDPCTECGLCVSACRSGCIIPSPEQVQRDTSAADTDNDTIWIGCEKSTRKNSMVRACISALTWETLAYLALNKKIVLDLTPCGECENDLCAAQLRKELTRLVDFFGQPMFEARFTLAYEPDEALYHVKELSRREMFEQVSHGSKSGTKKLLQMLPGLHSEDDGGVDFRLLLHQRTKQLKASMETPLKYGYYLPNFTDKCFGCGKCEKACRAGALKLEDLPDGQTRIVITPWKCSECEVCVASCSNHGIDGMKLRQLTTLGPVSIYKCTKTLCKECGKPIAPDSAEGVCTVCRIKARTKKRQEEAAARAKQLREEREAKKAAEEAAKAAEEAGAAVSGPRRSRCSCCSRFGHQCCDACQARTHAAGRDTRSRCAEKRLTARRFNAILTIKPPFVRQWTVTKGVTDVCSVTPFFQSTQMLELEERGITLCVIPFPAVSS